MNKEISTETSLQLIRTLGRVCTYKINIQKSVLRQEHVVRK